MTWMFFQTDTGMDLRKGILQKLIQVFRITAQKNSEKKGQIYNS